MSSHDKGEAPSDTGRNARLPLPAHPRQTGRPSSALLSPMSCRSCRQRKSKCSRKIPTCESCQRHGFQCLYDAVPKKRVPNSHLVKDLLHRVHSLEQQSTDRAPDRAPQQNDQEVRTSTATSQEEFSVFPSSAISGPPIPPPTIEPDVPTRREMLGVFFTYINGNPYTFVHERTLRKEILNSQAPIGFLYALCALCTSYMTHMDQETMKHQAENYLELSESLSASHEFSIETIQMHIMQVLCLICLGHGVRAWMKLGAAIRLVQGHELHMESFQTHQSAIQRDIIRLCIHTLYAMDRFSVCGSNRPMMFSDDTLRSLRLPSFDDVSDAPGAKIHPTPKFSELWVSVRSENQRQTILHMFTNIVVLLGKCNQYLQTGGVQGDSHFPWHPMSNLSGLVSELEKWRYKVESEVNPHHLDISQATSVNRFYLSWFIYHTIFVRLYRQFLPLISGSKVSDDLSDPWQQETSRKCVEHAVKISQLCAQAHAHGYSWPYFTAFCLGCACTVLIHSAYYEFAATAKSHLVNVVGRILDMRRCSCLVDYQCDMLRKMHILHAVMVRNYLSGTLVTTNMHLTQFYKRYPEGEFDQAHIPFSTLSNWMATSLDGPDDLFAIDELSQRLTSLRGIPYTFNGQSAPDAESLGHSTPIDVQSAMTSGSLFQESQIYSPSLMSALDGYFEFEGSSGSRGLSDSGQIEPCEDIGQDLINSVLQQVSEDEYGDLTFN